MGGLWGGKLIYDYLQEQRIKAELIELAEFMDSSIRNLDNHTRQVRLDMQKRANSESRNTQQNQANEQKNRIEETVQLQQEKNFNQHYTNFGGSNMSNTIARETHEENKRRAINGNHHL